MPAEKYKTLKCKVLSYDKNTKELDVDFNGYGVRLHNVSKNIEDYVVVKYKIEIGKTDFICKV